MEKDLILQMKNMAKYYGVVHALDGVDFELERGEILCLCGENGAGKSTLIKILSGAESPTTGQIFINGEEVKITTPAVAHDLGISTVYQELVQIPEMSIMENIYLGRYKTNGGLVDFKQVEEKTLQLMDQLNIHFDPHKRIKELSTAQRQLVEIMKAVSFDSRIIIFDEPTSSLTTEETEILFGIIETLKKKGVSIIYISHKLSEIFRIGDHVTVLRDGKSIGTSLVSEINEDKLISMMVGRSVENQYPKQFIELGEEVLRVENITNKYVKNGSFSLRKGEVLGFGGLVGAGRTEIMRAVFGADPCEGKIYLHGKEVKNTDPARAIQNGFALVPEDRKDQGLVLGLSIKDNVGLSSLKRYVRLLFVNDAQEERDTDEHIEKLRIRTPSKFQFAKNLSGGNQQKVVLARCLVTKPDVLILDEPTRGIDVSAKAEIYQIINQLAAEGVSIIMISSDMPELMAMSDRIIVMSEGRIRGELTREEISDENIMKLATVEGE